MILIPSLLLGLSLISAPSPEASSGENCPVPARQAPLYPTEMMRNNVSGTATVRARVDGCGRVVGPTIVESSGHPTLDRAALDTVLLWVLNEDERRVVGDGWVNLPVVFGGVRTVVPKPVDWPRSHRRPRYLPDEEPIGFPTIEAYRKAAPGRSEPVLKSPYGSVTERSGLRTSTAFQQDRADPMTYWLSYVVQRPPPVEAPRGSRASLDTIAVARYRLVSEDGKPVVRIALLCEYDAQGCDQLRAFLMQGLPIAKPPRA
jgi:TonB family protein